MGLDHMCGCGVCLSTVLQLMYMYVCSSPYGHAHSSEVCSSLEEEEGKQTEEEKFMHLKTKNLRERRKGLALLVEPFLQAFNRLNNLSCMEGFCSVYSLALLVPGMWHLMVFAHAFSIQSQLFNMEHSGLEVNVHKSNRSKLKYNPK